LEPQFNAWALVFLVAAGHAFLMGVALASSSRGNSTARFLLATMLIVFALRLTEVVAYWTKYLLVFPHLFSTTVPIMYLYGPLLYLYARSVGSAQSGLRPRDLLHGLPALAHALAYLPLYVLSGGIKVQILQEYVFTAPTGYTIDLQFLLHFFQLPHLLLYMVLTVRLLGSFERQEKEDKSGVTAPQLHWLKHLTAAFGLIWLCWFIYNLGILAGVPYVIELDYIVSAGVVSVVLGIGFFAFRAPDELNEAQAPRKTKRYARSGLTPSDAHRHLDDLDRLMIGQELYRDKNLRLDDLAAHLAIGPHHLSQAMNEHLGKTFHEVVNGYRVEYVKRHLTDPSNDHLTILGVAFDAGFNSKATFNTAFKKATGQTPSQFRATIRVDAPA